MDLSAITHKHHKKKRSYQVRVLLSEVKPTASVYSWNLSSPQGFILHNPAHKQGKKIQCHTTDLMVTIKKNKLFINNKLYKQKNLVIAPKQNLIAFDNLTYRGTFFIVHENDMFYLINGLDLEDYIFGVLKTESWPGWPLEVNKAFAIASRSYVLAMMQRSKKTNKVYHIKNTNAHQTYGGVHECRIIEAAVKQTEGVFLGYNNQPIIAMFDCCCGGIIPAHTADFDFDKAPYLARDYACHYCKSCKIYNWQAAIPIHRFIKTVRKELPELKSIRGIKVAKKDQAGLVQEIHFKPLQKGFIALSGKKMYSLFPEIKSFAYTINRKGDDVLLKGRGYGHHLGVCQWGAREMVRDGRDYQSILRFYYPGTTFMKLS